jgi:hypothetical protein
VAEAAVLPLLSDLDPGVSAAALAAITQCIRNVAVESRSSLHIWKAAFVNFQQHTLCSLSAFRVLLPFWPSADHQVPSRSLKCLVSILEDLIREKGSKAKELALGFDLLADACQFNGGQISPLDLERIEALLIHSDVDVQYAFFRLLGTMIELRIVSCDTPLVQKACFSIINAVLVDPQVS